MSSLNVFVLFWLLGIKMSKVSALGLGKQNDWRLPDDMPAPEDPGWRQRSEQEIQQRVNMAMCIRLSEISGLSPIPPGFCEGLKDTGYNQILRAILDQTWPELMKKKARRAAEAAGADTSFF